MKDVTLALGSFLLVAFLIGFSFTINSSENNNDSLMASIAAIDIDYVSAKQSCVCDTEYKNFKNATRPSEQAVSVDVQQRAMTIYAECLSLNSKSPYVHGLNKPVPSDRENMCPVPHYLDSGLADDYPNKCAFLTRAADVAKEALEASLKEYRTVCSVRDGPKAKCNAAYSDYFEKELNYAKARQGAIRYDCPLKNTLPPITHMFDEAAQTLN